jgi:hypothetical protein
MASQPLAGAPQSVLRAKEIRADAVRAGIIYAKEVEANDGRVGRIFEGETEVWERERKDDKVSAANIAADVIYAKEIKAGWVEAREIHAKKVRIRRR